MYKDAEWKLAIRYPQERPRRFYSRSDVFDGTVYKTPRRGAGRFVDFLALGYCADAIQVDKRMARNVLPGILRCVLCLFIYIIKKTHTIAIIVAQHF